MKKAVWIISKNAVDLLQCILGNKKERPMGRIAMRLVFTALLLVKCVHVFAGGWEDYVVYGTSAGFPKPPSSLPSSVVSPSELREFRFPNSQKSGAVAVVPNHYDAAAAYVVDESFPEVPVLTPSQEVAVALNRFAVLKEEEEELGATKTPSPVKRARVETLLTALVEEAKKDPVQLRALLANNPEEFCCLKELLSAEREASPKKRRSFREDDSRRRSLSSGSLDRVVTAKA